jgi:hypothetical protein
MSDDPVGLVVGGFVVNFAYLLGLVFLAALYDASATSIASDALSGAADQLVQSYIMIGGFLAIFDVLGFVGFFASMARQ